MEQKTDWRCIEWPEPDPNCATCKGNPYWGKTLSSWTRCECVNQPAPRSAPARQGEC